MSPVNSSRRAHVLGYPVDALSLEHAVDRAESFIHDRKPGRVGAINAAKLVRMQKEPDLAAAVSDCEIVLPDGVGVVWAAWLLEGVRMRRVPGIDVMERLMERAAQRGYGVYFLGARQAVLEEMIRRLRGRYPGLRVAGSHHGYFSGDEQDAIVADIRACETDILFVGLGTPAKELWIDRHFRDLGVPVAMGVGGSFDVLSGAVKRAPRWMQRTGFEWFYRFLQEPRRMWKRYFVTSFGFFIKVLMLAMRRPFSHRETV